MYLHVGGSYNVQLSDKDVCQPSFYCHQELLKSGIMHNDCDFHIFGSDPPSTQYVDIYLKTLAPNHELVHKKGNCACPLKDWSARHLMLNKHIKKNTNYRASESDIKIFKN